MIDRYWNDLRHAARAVRGAPGFSTIAILSIAIAIAANTTVFTLVNAVYLAPLPMRDADRLYDVYEHNPDEVCAGCGVGTSYALYKDLRAQTRSFADVGAHADERFVLNDGDAPVRVRGGTVSAGLLEMLDTAPIVGRSIQPEDDRPGAPRVALLSESLWRARYAADRSIIGRDVRLNGDWHTIVGVMPERARFPNAAQVWVAIAPRHASTDRDERTISVLGRLADGVDETAARAELSAFGTAVAQEYPGSNTGWSLHAMKLRTELAGDYTAVWPLLATVLFVLLIACANLAGLLLTRGTARRADLGVRIAIGAGQRDLVRLLLLESVLIATTGAVVGILAAWWATDFIATIAPAAVPFWSTPSLDWRVIAFAIGLTLLTGIGVGLVPAFECARIDVATIVNETTRGGTQSLRATRMRRVFVAAEIAAAMLLLTGAGLATKSFLNARLRAMPYDTRNLMRADLRLLGSRYDTPTERVRVTNEVIERIARVPGITSVGASSLFIVDWPEAPDRGVQIEGVSDELANAVVHHAPIVSPNYFSTLGLPIVEGRVFTADDVNGAPLVAVVDQAMAARIWPDQSPIGKRLRLGRSATAPWISIVGVVGNARPTPRRDGTYVPLLYLPIAQHPQSRPAGQPITLDLRVNGSPAGLARALARAINDVDPQLTLESLGTYEQLAAEGRRPFRTVMLLMTGLTAVALALALMGVYGTAAYAVVTRKREFGIRMALGATPRGVERLVLRGSLALTIAGVAAGLAAAVLFAPMLRSLLYGVQPLDPIVLALAALLLGVAAMLASYLPARRVSRIDPAATLHDT